MLTRIASSATLTATSPRYVLRRFAAINGNISQIAQSFPDVPVSTVELISTIPSLTLIASVPIFLTAVCYVTFGAKISVLIAEGGYGATAVGSYVIMSLCLGSLIAGFGNAGTIPYVLKLSEWSGWN